MPTSFSIQRAIDIFVEEDGVPTGLIIRSEDGALTYGIFGGVNTAAQVGVVDSGNNYTATDLEGILTELPTKFVPKARAYVNAAEDVLNANVTGDSEYRFTINADGKIEWGPGNAVFDVNLYRASPTVLKTDATFVIGGNAQIQGGDGLALDIIAPYVTQGVLLKGPGGVNGMLVRADQIAFYQPIRSVGQNPATVPLIIKGETLQTANLQEWLNSSGTAVAYVSANGTLTSTNILGSAGTALVVRSPSGQQLKLGVSGVDDSVFLDTSAHLNIKDAYNLVLGTTTGTKIGTATTQKIGFYNATPVVQPSAVADATDAASAITQLNALLSRVRSIGLIAA